MTASAPSRGSRFLSGAAPEVAGAPPLVYRDVALQGRPDRLFSLTLQPGEIVAAVGEENSGVEALGSLALGLTAPVSGAVEVFGLPIAELSYYDLLVFRRRLGYLPQGDGLLQNLSLRDNVALPVRFATDHRLREVDEKVTQLVEDFRLRAIAGMRPAQASLEDCRRAAAARAVALDPALVVLELPFVGLTGRSAVDLLDRVSRTESGARRAVLLTSRDLTPSVRGLVTRALRVVDGVATDEKK